MAVSTAAAGTIACAAASGVLFALALPPFNIEPLGWAAFVPLLWAVARPVGEGDAAKPLRPLYALGLGLIAGLVCGAVQVGWRADRSGLEFAYLPFVWIALVIGIVAAGAGFARGRFRGGLPWVVWVACAGVAVEWLTTFSPLPVGIALSQFRNIALLQIAPVFGIWGVSFLLWLVNAALADALLSRHIKSPALAVALATALVAHLAGAAIIATIPAQPTVTVAAIQDYNGVEAGAFAPTVGDSASASLPEKEDLIRQAAHQGATLIVGTEEGWGAGFNPQRADDDVYRLARETGAHLVVGYEERAAPKSFNCAALVTPGGATVGIHHKIRLFLGERLVVQAGDRARAWDTTLGKVGLLICFDSCYTTSTREAVRDGAQIIALPNYDPPTARGILHNLHAALLPFRAAENRVAYVRADPNGQSQIIDPWGRIVAQSPMYQAVALVAPVPLGSGNPTPFTRWGDMWAWACGVGVACGLVRKPKRFLKRLPDAPTGQA